MSYRNHHIGAGKATQYDRGFWHPGTTKHLLWSIERQLILDIVRQRQPSSALDFACGTGRVLSVLKEEILDTVGVDISPEMADFARTRCPATEIRVGDVIRNGDLVTEDFELISAFRFFLNAEDQLRRDVLAWMRERLSAGGAIVVNFHLNPTSLAGIHARLAGLWLGRQRRMLSLAGAIGLLREAGFDVESATGYGYSILRVDQLRWPRVQTAIERRLTAARLPASLAQAFVLLATAR